MYYIKGRLIIKPPLNWEISENKKWDRKKVFLKWRTKDI